MKLEKNNLEDKRLLDIFMEIRRAIRRSSFIIFKRANIMIENI